jgi:hypothetical protein
MILSFQEFRAVGACAVLACCVLADSASDQAESLGRR